VWTCACPALSQSRLASPPRQPLASPWDHKPRLQYLAAWQARLHRAPLAGQASGSSSGWPGFRQLFAARQEPGQAPQYARSWVDELNARGYSVCGVDQQGLGYSEGVRGYVERFADYVTDVLQFAKCASRLPCACSVLAAPWCSPWPDATCMRIADAACGSGQAIPDLFCSFTALPRVFVVLALLGMQSAASRRGPLHTLAGSSHSRARCSRVSMHAYAFMRKSVVLSVAPMRASAGPWQRAKSRALRTCRCLCAAARSAGASW
jgi:hypothetical protein